jgi:hypothetical protein
MWGDLLGAVACGAIFRGLLHVGLSLLGEVTISEVTSQRCTTRSQGKVSVADGILLVRISIPFDGFLLAQSLALKPCTAKKSPVLYSKKESGVGGVSWYRRLLAEQV